MIRSTITLTSPIFDKAKRQAVIQRIVVKNAKQFKRKTVERMEQGPQTGKLYAQRRGFNFRRSHRASARGQRPAVQTGKLSRGIVDTKLGPATVEVASTAT